MVKPSTKVVLVPSIVLILLGCLGLAVIDHQLKSTLDERINIELEWLAKNALVTLASTNALITIETADPIAKKLSEISGARITFIDSNGKVTGDSSVEHKLIADMTNHIDRIELVRSRQDGSGFSVRYSDTLELNFHYVAVYRMIEVAGQVIPYYSRASFSSLVLENQMKDMRMALMSLLLAGVLSISMIIFFILRFVSSSILSHQSALEMEVALRTQEIDRMHHLDSLLNACSEITEARLVVEKLIPSLLPDTLGAISIYKQSRNLLKMKLFWGGQWQGSCYYNPDQCWALRRGHEHLIVDSDSGVQCEHTMENTGESSLCIPLSAHGETVGVMHILKDNFDDDTIVLAQAVAKRIAISIANIELKTSLRQQAFRDSLTQLYNRRYLFETMNQWVSSAKRKHTQIGIMMVDLDHFKRVNDNNGHDIGDKALKRVAAYFLTQIRDSDIVCRYGGEEFCIVIADTEPKALMSIAEEIRIGVEGVSIPITNKENLYITCSIGLALYSSDSSHKDPSIETTISQADEALYLAKKDGRNCVKLYSSN
ncbi:diguanylate cyclase [Vibrio paucivorans]